MTKTQLLLTIAAIALGTLLTRVLPFLLFPAGRKTPDYIIFLGKALPSAVIGLLVVYCLKGITLTSFPFGLPEIIAVLVVGIVHAVKGNTLLSIALGTASYMFLVQAVF